MSFPYGEDVTRLRGTPVIDPYSGEQVDLDWDDPDSETTSGWGVDDSRSQQPPSDGSREAVITDFVLYRDESADIAEHDRVIVRGQPCEVVGRPATWHNPLSGWSAGFVVRANIVKG